MRSKKELKSPDGNVVYLANKHSLNNFVSIKYFVFKFIKLLLITGVVELKNEAS